MRTANGSSRGHECAKAPPCARSLIPAFRRASVRSRPRSRFAFIFSRAPSNRSPRAPCSHARDRAFPTPPPRLPTSAPRGPWDAGFGRRGVADFPARRPSRAGFHPPASDMSPAPPPPSARIRPRRRARRARIRTRRAYPRLCHTAGRYGGYTGLLCGMDIYYYILIWTHVHMPRKTLVRF